MANLQLSPRGKTFSSHTLQFATDCLDRNTLLGSSEYSFSQPISSFNSPQDESMCGAHCQSNLPWNKFSNTSTSLNDQNPGLIPLKLGSALKPPRPTSSVFWANSTSSMINRELNTTKRLDFLPSTRNEWKSAMAEVKSTYLKGQYEHCARRSRMLLSRTKESPSIEPAYRIYLASYLAYSLEIMASSRTKNISTKIQHFQEALDCYHSATLNTEAALCAVNLEISEHYSSEVASIPSSARSSVDSVFSHYSAPSSISSTSPDESSRSEERGEYNCPKTRREKKVNFSSPTLNPVKYSLDHKDVFHSATSNSLLDSFPIPPSNISPITSPALTFESATTSLHEDRSLEFSSSSVNSSDSIRLKHLIKYRSLLIDSRYQFNYHITTTEKHIDELCQSTTTHLDSFSQVCDPSEERFPSTREYSRNLFSGSHYHEKCERACSEL